MSLSALPKRTHASWHTAAVQRPNGSRRRRFRTLTHRVLVHARARRLSSPLRRLQQTTSAFGTLRAAPTVAVEANPSPPSVVSFLDATLRSENVLAPSALARAFLAHKTFSPWRSPCRRCHSTSIHDSPRHGRCRARRARRAHGRRARCPTRSTNRSRSSLHGTCAGERRPRPKSLIPLTWTRRVDHRLTPRIAERLAGRRRVQVLPLRIRRHVLQEHEERRGHFACGRRERERKDSRRRPARGF